MSSPKGTGAYGSLSSGEIRILLLYPGLPGEPLVAAFKIHALQPRTFEERYERCEKHVSTLNGLPVESMRTPDGYDAISYVWGGPCLSQVLTIGHRGEIGITQSLYDALQQIRDEHVVRRLWADAVCINQADNQEKSAQVAIMHKIYGSADVVLVWLGPSERQDALAFATIQAYSDISSAPDFRPPIWKHVRAPMLDKLRTALHCLCKCPSSNQSFDSDTADLLFSGTMAFIALLSRPWFTRLWVVQEVDIRATIAVFQSGHHSMTLMRFQYALWLLRDVLGEDIVGISKTVRENALDQIHHFMFEYESRGPSTWHAWCCMDSLLRRDCSDPRDRVYAIRSCLGMEGFPALEPDYTIGVQECFRRWTCTVLEEANFHVGQDAFREPWRALERVGTEHHSSAEDEEWPSWIPKLHQMPKYLTFKYSKFEPNHRLFIAIVDDADNSKISLKGRTYGMLQTPSEDSVWPGSHIADSHDLDFANHWRTAILNWYMHCVELASPLLGPSFEAAWKFHIFLQQGYPLDDSMFCHIDDFPKAWPPALPGELGGYNLKYVESFKHRHIEPADRICLIRQEHRGYIGWVPRASRTGDLLCLFGGCPRKKPLGIVPIQRTASHMVMRPTEN